MRQYSGSEKLIIFLITFVGGVLLAGLLSLIPFAFSDQTLADLGSSDGISKFSAEALRLQLFLNHLGMFLIPSLVYGLYVYGRSNFLKGYELSRFPIFVNLILGIAFLAACYPLVNLLHYINSMIPMSEWMIGAEQNVRETLEKILSSDNRVMLILNILLISVMPAIGEELIFRGILQNLIGQITKNKHIGLWIAAFLFSAIHLQFEGFLARMALGAILGYSYYFTKNLWVPILLHFLNNLIPILAFMLLDTDLTDTSSAELGIQWEALLLSIVLVPAIVYSFLKVNHEKLKQHA